MRPIKTMMSLCGALCLAAGSARSQSFESAVYDLSRSVSEAVLETRRTAAERMPLPPSEDFRLKLTEAELKRFEGIAAHIHHKVPGRKLEFPEPTGYERVTRHYGFQIEGDARPDGMFDLKAFILTHFVARPEGLHDYVRMEIAPDGTILSADDPRLGRRPPSGAGPQMHGLMNRMIAYWDREWPAF